MKTLEELNEAKRVTYLAWWEAREARIAADSTAREARDRQDAAWDAYAATVKALDAIAEKRRNSGE